jgi:hypothetical protein
LIAAVVRIGSPLPRLAAERAVERRDDAVPLPLAAAVFLPRAMLVLSANLDRAPIQADRLGRDGRRWRLMGVRPVGTVSSTRCCRMAVRRA